MLTSPCAGLLTGVIGWSVAAGVILAVVLSAYCCSSLIESEFQGYGESEYRTLKEDHEILRNVTAHCRPSWCPNDVGSFPPSISVC
jgi:hypothetical protein